MKKILALSFCAWLCLAIGCTVGKNPTPQQIQAAQEQNKALSQAARIAFEALEADIDLARSQGKISASASENIATLESSITAVLDEMDTAAAGDPNQFETLAFDEGLKEAKLWIAMQLINQIIPTTQPLTLGASLKAPSKIATPSTYVKGSTGNLTLVPGNDFSGSLNNVIFQTWSSSGNKIEGAIAVTKSPWVYPAASLSQVQDGVGEVQAILRDKNNKSLLSQPVKAETVFVSPPPPPSNVIYVGPSRPVKVLTASQMTGTKTFILDTASFALPEINPKSSDDLTIVSADDTNWATLLLPSCWSGSSSGPDEGVPRREGTIQTAGKLTIRNLKVAPQTGVKASDMIFLGSSGHAQIIADHILLPGGGFYRGEGADVLNWTHIESTGSPRAYFVGLFGSQVNSFTWDNTDCLPIYQGGAGAGASRNGETAIRLMWGQKVDFINLHVIGKKLPDENGKLSYWKQTVQDRASGDVGDYSGVHTWTGCVIDGPMEIDWMGGKRDPSEVRRPLGTFVANGCTLQSEPVSHYRSDPPSCTTIYTHDLIGGKSVTKTISGKR